MVDATCRVLVTHPFHPALLEQLEELSPRVNVLRRRFGEVTAEEWRETDVLYTRASLPMPDQVPRLGWVQLHFAGAEWAVSHPLFATDVRFTTTAGANAIPAGEYVLGMMLAWTHRVRSMVELQQARRWPSDEDLGPKLAPQELYGKTIGIVGYGSIGRQVARLARAFGMRVVTMQRDGVARERGGALPEVGDPGGVLPDRRYARDELHALLGESDIVVLLVPLTAETRGMIDAAALSACRPTALLINVSRGEVCDEDALIEALREERIAGAVLDVFREEPLPATSPIWDLPNVLVSPHLAGRSPHHNERTFNIFADNLRRYLAGEPLLNLMSKSLGY